MPKDVLEHKRGHIVPGAEKVKSAEKPAEKPIIKPVPKPAPKPVHKFKGK